MAGAKGRSGRPRKPTAELKLHGNFREDRHGSRNDEPQPEGQPQPPEDLSPYARIHWDMVVPDLIASGVAKHIDTLALAAASEWWAEWKKLQNGEAVSKNRIGQMAKAHGEWVKMVKDFGLTPAARASLTVESKKERDPAAEFIA